MSRKKRRIPLQFSKRMSVTVTVFWILFRLVEIAAAVWQPTIADALVKLVAGVDSVMMVNLGFYCGNSVAEKAILAWMDSRVNQDKDDDDDQETITYAIKNETTLEEAEELTQQADEEKDNG